MNIKQLLRRVVGSFSPPATSRQDILKASRPKVREIFIEQFNATVYLRPLSVKDARELRHVTPQSKEEKSLDELSDELEMYYARLMAYCVLDKDDNPIYTLEDVLNFDTEVYNQLFFALTDFNKLNVDIEQVKDELKKSPVTSLTTN